MTEDNKNMQQLLDEFIDDLAAEKKPRAYQSDANSEQSIDQETEKLLETVRAVKRYAAAEETTTEKPGEKPGEKPEEKPNEKPGEKSEKKFYRSGWFKGAVAAAAVLVLALGFSLFQLPGGHQPGVVQAFVQAYESMEGYRGVFEIRSESNEQVDSKTTINVSYKKPHKYKALHEYNGFEQKYTSDGKKLVEESYNRVTVEQVFPEKELWRYHIGTLAGEMNAAEEIEVVGEEVVFGRTADVVEYSYKDDIYGETHVVWIDQDTHLPLRKELRNPEGQLVVEFRELEMNPEFASDTFKVEIPSEPEPEPNILNRLAEPEELEAEYPEVEAIQEAIPEDMHRERIGYLKNNVFFDYVLRYQEPDAYEYLDVFLTRDIEESSLFPDSKKGVLGEGYVELNANVWNLFDIYIGSNSMAQWIKPELGIILVSNRPVDELQDVLENLAGEAVEFN